MDYSGKQAKVKLIKHYYSNDIFTGVITTELMLLEHREKQGYKPFKPES